MARPQKSFDGILAVDKPQDWTSHDVVAKMRAHFQIKKIGHAGTLDPLATGVLVILCGVCTRLSDELMASEKAYRFTARFGQTTDTQDITGHVTAEAPLPADWSAERLEAAMGRYRGEIMQLPPMFSAVKVHGERLYKAGRRGEEVAREARPVTIKEFSLLSLNGEEGCFYCRCTKGTYVRTLAHDLGADLGCGATLSALQRTASGGLTLCDCATLEEILQWDEERLRERLLATWRQVRPDAPEGARV